MSGSQVGPSSSKQRDKKLGQIFGLRGEVIKLWQKIHLVKATAPPVSVRLNINKVGRDENLFLP